MSSPHERDGRFYGRNEDPYTRDPYRDPYTGDRTSPYDDTPSAEVGSSTRAWSEAPEHEARPVVRPKPFLDDDRPSRGVHLPANIGLDAPKFIGGVVAVAVIVALTTWLAVGVVLRWIYTDPATATVWARLGEPAPQVHSGAAIALAVLATVLAAIALVGFVILTPAPRTLFVITGLIVTAIAVAVPLGGPWQLSLGPALIRLGVGVVIVSLVARIGELTVTRSRDIRRTMP